MIERRGALSAGPAPPHRPRLPPSAAGGAARRTAGRRRSGGRSRSRRFRHITAQPDVLPDGRKCPIWGPAPLAAVRRSDRSAHRVRGRADLAVSGRPAAAVRGRGTREGWRPAAPPPSPRGACARSDPGRGLGAGGPAPGGRDAAPRGAFYDGLPRQARGVRFAVQPSPALSTRRSSAPMPSISHRSRSPGLRKTGGFRKTPTPAGVPVRMRSPASRGATAEM